MKRREEKQNTIMKEEQLYISEEENDVHNDNSFKGSMVEVDLNSNDTNTFNPLQDFDPTVLSPPLKKSDAIKAGLKKRIKAGIMNIIILVWNILIMIVNIVMLVVYFNQSAYCDQPIWSWLLVNLCVMSVASPFILFLRKKKLIFIATLYVLFLIAWSTLGVVYVAREKSCVGDNANGAHLFSIVHVVSNFFQCVVILTFGSFLIGLNVARKVREEMEKKSDASKTFDNLNHLVNYNDDRTEETITESNRVFPFGEEEKELEPYTYPIDEIDENYDSDEEIEGENIVTIEEENTDELTLELIKLKYNL
ncbi:hypothetical protein ABK040_008327 [Willaertia magna]